VRIGIALLLGAYLWCTGNAEAQSIEIRGRAVSQSGQGLPGVELTIANSEGVRVGAVQTANDGRFSYRTTSELPLYQLTFRKLGYVMLSRSLARPDTGSLISVGNIVLVERLDILEPVSIRTARLVTSRGERRPTGSKELDIKGISDLVPDPSDINSLLDGLREANETEGGRSILGANPSQNRTLVDGADFGASNLPRDAIQTAKLLTNPYDPSKGRFAGGAIQVTTRPGSPRFDGTFRVQSSPALFGRSDRPTHEPAPNRWAGSGFLSGPVGKSGLKYLVAVDASHQSTSVLSLASDNIAQRNAVGISEDSVVAMKQSLLNLGAPIGQAQLNSTGNRGSAITRIDFQRSTQKSLFLSVIHNWDRFSNTSISKLALPTTGTDLRAHATRAQMNSSTYLGKFLYESNLAGNLSQFSSAPTTELAHGVLRLGTTIDGTSAGSSIVTFGGASDGRGKVENRSLFWSNSLAWVEQDGRHSLKVAVEAVTAGQRSASSANEFGIFEFLSLADLANNTPALFRRNFPGQRRSVRDWNVGASIGDSWRVRPGKLEVQGGVRFDASMYPRTPAYNAAVDSLLGVRTDQIPSAFDVSPRLGFSWRPFGTSRTPLVPGGTTTLESTGAQASRTPLDAGGIAIQPDADVITVSGGFGLFRGTTNIVQLSTLMDQSGSDLSRRHVSCTGESAPRADWRNPMVLDESDCDDGAALLVYNRSDVSTLSPNFRPPVSYRGNLAIDGISLWKLKLAPQLVFTIGKRSESVIDRNLRSTPAFVSSSDGNRSVFAPKSAIDARSGFIATGAARVYPSLGAVRMHISDLEYRATQLSLALAPVNPVWGASRVFFVYGYSLQDHQTREYGSIDAPKVWQDGPSPRHRFDVGLTELGPRWFRMLTRATIQSGRAFTPLVAQDVNGDGIANDRAFIPSAGNSTSTEFDTFVANANPLVRSCLNRQSGAIASAFSCRTGWRIKFDVAVNGTAPSDFGLGQRVRFSLNFFNVSSALVQLLKLDDTPFARDARSPVDQRLFFVSGFDSTANRFSYQLNSNFGRPRPTIGSSGLSPFEVRIGVQFLLGASAPQVSRIDAMRSRTPQGSTSPISRDSLVRMFRGPDVLQRLTQLIDSLGLDDDQKRGIADVQRAYFTQRDSMLAEVFAVFETQTQSRSVEQEVRTRMRDVGPSLTELERSSLARALSFLNEDQRRQYESLAKR
jgi:hypothetical protein